MSSYLDIESGQTWRRGGTDRPESYGKLLAVLTQLAHVAERLDDDGVREGTALAQLDAIDFGEQLGLLDGEEAQRRRPAAEAAFPDPGP